MCSSPPPALRTSAKKPTFRSPAPSMEPNFPRSEAAPWQNAASASEHDSAWVAVPPVSAFEVDLVVDCVSPTLGRGDLGSPARVGQWDGFSRRLEGQSARLDALGVNRLR